MDTRYRACTLCEAHCGLSFQYDGKQLVAVRGDPYDAFSKGYICPKGVANRELHQDPDRLRMPVRRTASGSFEPIGWEEAFGLALSGLQQVRKKRGQNSLGAFFGNPLVHNPGGLLARGGLARAVGSERAFGTSSQDTSPRFASSYHLYGCSMLVPIPDLERTDFLLCLGANPVVSNGSFLTAPDMKNRLRAIRQRGGRVVVVDPRLTETAKDADEHVSILPGGDAAFLLGMVNVLLAEGRVNSEAIAKIASGWDSVASVIVRIPLEHLADACGVRAETLTRLARDFATARTSVVYSRLGTCNNRYGTLATYATDLLNLAAGRLGESGGALFARPAVDITRLLRLPGADGHARFRSRVRKLPETVGEIPGSCLAEEIETAGEGQVHGLVTCAANPVLSTPNGRRLDRALATLDFMVAVDPYVNETTRHAHVILPPASSLSDEHLDFFLAAFSVRNATRVSPPVVPATQGAFHDWQIMRRLSEGLGGGFTGQPVVDLPLRALRSFGVDVTPTDIAGLLLRTGRNGDHFLPFSKGWSLAKLRRQKHGVDLGGLETGITDRVAHRDHLMHADAPVLADALRNFATSLPVGHSEGELLLIGRRDLRSNNSWMHNLPSLMKGKPRCVLLVHPEDAQAAGLIDGELAWLESRVHAGAVPVKFSTDMRRGVVSLPHGYGHQGIAAHQRTAGTHAGVSANDWSDDADVESVVGQSILNGIRVRLGPLPVEADAFPAMTEQ